MKQSNYCWTVSSRSDRKQLAHSKLMAGYFFDDIKSPIDLPRRPRSTRDGYAVNVIEDAEPGRSFKIIGDVRIGTIPKIAVKDGEAVRVATGSYIPKGANAVIMVEYVEVQDKELRANKAIRVHDNILSPGEDMTKGQLLLSKGARIHPQHLSLFSMLGIRRVNVFSKPKIAFFSTGDETNRHQQATFEEQPRWSLRGHPSIPSFNDF